MPAESVLQRRNRAVIAFAVLTGARVAALASFRLGDINVDESFVDQDARHVKTKFSKTFRTFLMPVSDLAMSIAKDWHAEMTADGGARARVGMEPVDRRSGPRAKGRAFSSNKDRTEHRGCIQA